MTLKEQIQRSRDLLFPAGLMITSVSFVFGIYVIVTLYTNLAAPAHSSVHPASSTLSQGSTDLAFILPKKPPLPRLLLSVYARCKGNTAVFKILNQGAEWQEPGLIKITGPYGKQILAKHRVRMGEKKSLTVRFRNATRFQHGVALKVRADWANVPNDARTKITCTRRPS